MGRVRTAINLRQANATDYEAKLRMSYRSIAETVPRQIMAEALLAAFRSSDLGLAKLVEELTPVLGAALALSGKKQLGAIELPPQKTAASVRENLQWAKSRMK